MLEAIRRYKQYGRTNVDLLMRFADICRPAKGMRPYSAILRKVPNIKWTKDRGKEPGWDKRDVPWFWNGKAFTGDRVNAIPLTIAEKQACRAGFPA